MIDEETIREIYEAGRKERREAHLKTFWSHDAMTIRPSWEIFRSKVLDETIARAVDLGWAENKVQVKQQHIDSITTEYFIEPYEENCGCSGLLKYEDYAHVPQLNEG